jgi:iron complex outermembrane receptor protein
MVSPMMESRSLVRRGAAACRTIGAIVLCLGVVLPAAAQSSNVTRLKELSLEELASLDVTSVFRSSEPLADAPAAVFVITADDIRRSGATSLAEAIQLAPNVQAARMSAAQYAISARGFNNAIANKLLVLVDGRTIYTPLFSGVFWDQEDVFLENVERIEVISGPGATLWGANAVNGVINIITYRAHDTRGAVTTFAGGNREQHAAVRIGVPVGARGYLRVFGKANHLESGRTSGGADAKDGRRWMSGGFRADWGDEAAGLMLQGNVYDSRSDDRGSVAGFELGRVDLTGVNFTSRLTRRVGDDSDVRLQAYVVHYDRDDRVLFQPEADLVDLEFQHGWRPGRHRLASGGGYRYGRDTVEDGILVGFRPVQRGLHWENLFVHDEMRLNDVWSLSGGLKLERNEYTGWEYLPGARLAWKPAEDQLLWGSISRAVRAPARLDREVVTPAGTVIGGPAFQSEVANVFELGYRGRLGGAITASATTFVHRWDRLRSGTAPPVVIENRIEGPVFGVEAWATWQAAASWRVSGGVATIGKDLRLESGSTDPVGIANPQLANDPGYQWRVRSALNLWTTGELDAIVRRVAALPNPSVPAYTAVDARFAWRLRPDVELSLQGRNLFDPSHPEFGAAPGRSELPRSVLARVTWAAGR